MLQARCFARYALRKHSRCGGDESGGRKCDDRRLHFSALPPWNKSPGGRLNLDPFRESTTSRYGDGSAFYRRRWLVHREFWRVSMTWRLLGEAQAASRAYGVDGLSSSRSPSSSQETIDGYLMGIASRPCKFLPGLLRHALRNESEYLPGCAHPSDSNEQFGCFDFAGRAFELAPGGKMNDARKGRALESHRKHESPGHHAGAFRFLLVHGRDRRHRPTPW